MCRCDISPDARELLGALLAGMGRELAEWAGVPEDEVLIGPVDFGSIETEEAQ